MLRTEHTKSPTSINSPRNRRRSSVIFAAIGSYAWAAAFGDGFRLAMGTAAGLALAGAIAGVILPGQREGTPTAAAAELHSHTNTRNSEIPRKNATRHSPLQGQARSGRTQRATCQGRLRRAARSEARRVPLRDIPA